MSINIKKLSEKKRLEFWALNLFIRNLRRNYKRWLILKKFTDPPNPDFLCTLDGKDVWVEVAHLYGSQRDARLLLGRPKQIEQTKEARLVHALMPLNQRISSELSRILMEKARMRYDRRTWLVIRNGFPLWQREDFEIYRSEISIPEHHCFEEIWLVCDKSGASGILRLYPG